MYGSYDLLTIEFLNFFKILNSKRLSNSHKMLQEKVTLLYIFSCFGYYVTQRFISSVCPNNWLRITWSLSLRYSLDANNEVVNRYNLIKRPCSRIQQFFFVVISLINRFILVEQIIYQKKKFVELFYNLFVLVMWSLPDSTFNVSCTLYSIWLTLYNK